MFCNFGLLPNYQLWKYGEKRLEQSSASLKSNVDSRHRENMADMSSRGLIDIAGLIYRSHCYKLSGLMWFLSISTQPAQPMRYKRAWRNADIAVKKIYHFKNLGMSLEDEIFP